jgi:hypothetical protein
VKIISKDYAFKVAVNEWIHELNNRIDSLETDVKLLKSVVKDINDVLRCHNTHLKELCNKWGEPT